MRWTRLIPSLCLFFAGALAAPGLAGAEPDERERSGMVFGASIGPASLSVDCAGCNDLESLDDALSLSAHAGAMLTPRVALVVEHWAIRWDGRDNGWFGDSEDHVIRESLTTAGGQVWLTRKLWLRGGIGVSRHRTDTEYRDLEGGEGIIAAAGPTGPAEPPSSGSGRAPALAGAVGYEVIYTPAFAVDFALRAGASSRGDRGVQTGTIAFTIGATWF